MNFRILHRVLASATVLFLTGCAATSNNIDYSAFRESRPASILVLPPLNSSVDAMAVPGVLAQATRPLAESGYYVIPVALMDETFRQNGLFDAEDIHQLPASRLREIFGADAALYMDVKRYGSTYAVISSSVTVEIEANLVDLRTGATLWQGRRIAAESSGSGGGLIGMMLQAVVTQITNHLSDRSYYVAGMTSTLLFTAGLPESILHGPRSPLYELN